MRRRTFTEAQRYLEGSYFKPLHNVPVDAITRRDVAARILVIGQENGQVAAARARTALSALFSWAMEAGLCELNPVIGSPRVKAPPSRDRVLSDQELLAVWQAAGDDDFGKIVRLLVVTAQRRSEVGGMAWTEVDERGTWIIPAKRAKNGREHVLPLPALAIDIIKTVPRIVDRDALFGARADGFTNWGEPKRLLDAQLGDQVRPWVLHDIRRTVATRMADLAVPPHVIEEVLNHRSGHRSGVAGIYNRSRYEREVKAAVAKWNNHMAALIERRNEDNVSPMRLRD